LCAATLRLAPRLPTKVAMAQFKNVEQAVSAVQEILNAEYGSHIRLYFLFVCASFRG
jgi:D-lactate dehydrogenase (cytochrome)